MRIPCQPHRSLHGLCLALALLTAALPASAQIYRWTAPDGSVVMGDRPPPGVKATLISDKKAPARSDATDDAQARERQLKRQDEWQATIRRQSGAASAPAPGLGRPPGSTPGVHGGATPRPQGTPTAPQGDCARYRELLDLARKGDLKGCQGARCWKAESSEIEILERESREACARR